MSTIEKLIIDFLLIFFSHEDLFNFFGDSRSVAIIVGALVAISGAVLGTYLLLRKMSLTSDAISHTVLLGIVATFLVLTRGLSQEPDLTSPWLILGATVAGVVTVWLTELVFKSGLVKEDAALGLVFPLLFAVAVIMINRYVENIHLDQDAVWAGEIGLAFGKSNEYCYENCDAIEITPEHPKAKQGFECTNCVVDGEGPRTCRDDGAVCEAYCFNCGLYSASVAYEQNLTFQKPVRVLFPKAITAMGLITLLNVLFVTALYKELKLSTFDEGLAKTLGFRPTWLHYLLMALVSITAVGAFDAVGAILVVAFFIVPAATAYLLTDRLWLMLVISSIVGALAAYTGYDLSRGKFLFYEDAGHQVLALLDKTVGIGGYTAWDASPGASMVMMMGILFTLAWISSPRYGLIANIIQRFLLRRRFAEQMILVHLGHHQDTQEAREENRVATLHTHLGWSPGKVNGVLNRLKIRRLIKVEDGDLIALTTRGKEAVDEFYASRAS